jgi:hypothetical protein
MMRSSTQWSHDAEAQGVLEAEADSMDLWGLGCRADS